jgi:hypothetical protein
MESVSVKSGFATRSGSQSQNLIFLRKRDGDGIFAAKIKTGVQILSNLGARAALPQNCSITRYDLANNLGMALGCQRRPTKVLIPTWRPGSGNSVEFIGSAVDRDTVLRVSSRTELTDQHREFPRTDLAKQQVSERSCQVFEKYGFICTEMYGILSIGGKLQNRANYAGQRRV